MFTIRWFLFFLGFLSLNAAARTLPVGETAEYPKIRLAIADAEAGDTIRIQAGTYCESGLVVDKPLTLIGESGAILDGEGKEILVIMANEVTVEGLTFCRVATSHIEDRAAIRVKNVRDFLIRDNELVDTYFGVYLEHAKKGIVRGNRIVGEPTNEANTGNGIHAWYCEHLLVDDNYVKGHRDGIYFEFVDSSRITRNVSEGQLRYGLHFMFSNYDSYEDNTFRDNGAGVAVMFSKFIDMINNRFADNWGGSSYGLLLKEINDAEIQGNEFVHNTIGIHVEGGNRLRYLHNTFRQNGWALKISGGCMYNRVIANNFISNTFDLSQAGRGADNEYVGNYWSEYSGYDLDRDGVGDVPFRPIKLFSYVVDQTPEAMVMLRSLFVDLINLAEKVSPVLTPANVQDPQPQMEPLPIGGEEFAIMEQ